MDHATDERQERQLRLAAVVFAIASALHIADHVRRGEGSTTYFLQTLGSIALVPQAVTITLVLVRHRLAPLVAAATGPALALGFVAAHWLPEWSAMSDPVWEVESLPVLSAAASVGEIAGALLVGAAGIAIVRRRGLAAFAT